MIKIVYEDNHILVVEKPINIPVQGDSSGDLDFLTTLKEDLKKRYHKPGNVYLGLVHRLDRPVGGIMVFAKTSKAASRLSEQVRTHQFIKKYYAVVCGKIKEVDTYEDKLLKNQKTNIVTVHPTGKLAQLSYQRIGYDKKTNLSLVDISLKTGRSHQIRVQFSHHGHALYGDQKYSKYAKVGEQIALFSYQLTFIHPTTKETMEFTLNRPKSYPWNVFQS
ncbi:MAG: RluA family pseudouridine synthase [Firmicutes bacterium]|nr:RluA family pseudouridine synthase [Bacillota bacterium]